MDNTGHYYNVLGEPVKPWEPGALPSPTTILNILRKPELEAYRLRVGEDAANELMTKAQERGTRVHKACELFILHGNKERAEADAELQDDEPNYLGNFIKWLEKYEVSVINTEAFVLSRKFIYGGTLDLIVRIAGQVWIVDIKTGKPQVSHGLQLKFYEQAVYEVSGEHARMAVLALTSAKNGRPALKEYKETQAAIVSHINVFKWWRKKCPAEAPASAENIFTSMEGL